MRLLVSLSQAVLAWLRGSFVTAVPEMFVVPRARPLGAAMSRPLNRPVPGGEPNTTGASGAATTRP
jgi:hypothetical protein